MPIEIRELSVKVNIKEENQRPAIADQGANNNRQNAKVLNECLEQVAQLLRNKKER